ncbi:MAG: exopolysaccharide synthesis, ExoD family protein [Rickettsiaceae bacterium]|jgi:hypothetical protein|nr:exopolysaccharide synthesis, ExoD family protein [Rickettsiaceae bacterium]
MDKNKKKHLDNRLASETLSTLAKKTPDGKTRLKDIILEFHENGFALVMIFFSLPIAIPLPYPPGFTTLFGVPLILFSIQMMLGYENIKLSKRIEEYEINNSTLIMIAGKAIPILQRIEKYLKPRYSFANSVYCEQILGFISLVCAISIAIPLPLTNSIPAWGITVMSLGLLKRDGLIILLGILVSIIGNIIAFFAVMGSWYLVKAVFNYIFNF